MTDSFLKAYTLAIQTLSPVHIGSGVKLGKSDFLLRQGRAHVIDENKLMNWIIAQPNAEQLSLALMDDLRRPDGGIEKFLKERFHGDLTDVTAYSLPYQGTPKDVSAFIKLVDSHAYIPGSSIKGVLRSGLLRGMMLGDKGLRDKAIRAISQGASMRNKPRTNSDQIQANAFVHEDVRQSQWSNFDLNRALIIRDSEELPVGSLELLAVKTLSVQSNQSLKAKPYDIFVEAWPAGYRAQLAVSWQTNLFSQGARSLGLKNIEDLMVFLPDYCRRVSQDLLTQEISFYKRHARSDLAEWFQKRLDSLAEFEDSVFILPMGWSSGYDAKTITDLLGEETFDKVVETYKNTSGLGKPGRDKNAEWLGVEDSPKSRKIIERSTGAEPMGWVACWFVAEGRENWLEERSAALSALRPAALVIPTPSIGSVELPGSKTVVDAPQTPIVERKIIENFNAIPRLGDCFMGEVFDTPAGEILMIIPGMDDLDAYAVLKPGSYPKLMQSFKLIKCEVIGFEPDTHQKNCKRVLCKAL